MSVDVIALIGITRKGKDRIKRWGKEWRVIEVRGRNLMVVAMSDSSGDSRRLPDSVRWIEVEGDPDFTILAGGQ